MRQGTEVRIEAVGSENKALGGARERTPRNLRRLVACLMAVALVVLAAGPAFAATATTTTVTSSNNPAKAGEPVVFTATVTPSGATGTVQFKIDGANAGPASAVTGGTASLAISHGPGVGNHTVTAEYSGDATFGPSTGSLQGGQLVTKGDTTTTVSSSRNPAQFGDEVTFTAKVLPSIATGTVQFKIDGANAGPASAVTGGTASLAISHGPGVGNHTVTAEYSGDATFNPSAGTLAGGQEVRKKDTTTTVTSNPNPSAIGEDVTFTATVFPPLATGTVEFKIDGEDIESVPLSDGKAELTMSSEGSGTSSVVAEYSGNGQFNPSSGTLPGGQVVSKTATRTTVTGQATKLGEPINYIARVEPDEATGTVQFKVDGANLGSPVAIKDGRASTPVTFRSAGEHTVVAEYSGDDNFLPSSGKSAVTIDLLKEDTTTKLAVGINSVQGAKAVTFTATVSPAAATGTVQFKVDGTNVGSPIPLSGSKAKTAPIALSPGRHTIVAEYSGDARFNPSRATEDFNVKAPSGSVVLPRTGSSTVPLALLGVTLLVAGVLIQRKANRNLAAKLPPEDYRT